MINLAMSLNLKSRLDRIRNTRVYSGENDSPMPAKPAPGTGRLSAGESPAEQNTGASWPGWVNAGYMTLMRRITCEL
ncbi:MAG: hypothetical protein FWF26_05005, partial [Treponema sp.]|nr:hypothetical protein [Treponema sp.]